MCRNRKSSGPCPAVLPSAGPPILCRILLVAALAAPGSGSAGLFLNEVLYDPIGVDDGLEFVELYSTGPELLDLGRVAIERGNGNRPGDWREVWHGTSGDSLAPGVPFVVGGERVSPEPGAVAQLNLQNGPDGCRLLVDGTVVDVLGWGDLTGAEFFAGAPAPDVAAGSSLGRVPDGHDTGRNDLDFHAFTTPSPGRPNRRPPRLKLGSPGHRSSAEANPRLEVEWVVTADEEQSVASFEVRAFPCSIPEMRVAAQARLTDGEASGVLVLGPLRPGPLEICLVCIESVPGGIPEEHLPDTLRVVARAGPGPLRVNEFLYRPAAGETEWIEIVNCSLDTLAIADFALADSRSQPVELAGAPMIPPGGLLVISADRLPAPVASHVVGSRWPALNDAGMPFADRIRLLDAEARTSDDVAYGADWAPAGVSVERVSTDLPSGDRAAWSASAAGSSPGIPNAVALELKPVRGFLNVDPDLVRAGTEQTIVVQFAHPLRRGVLTVHASDGRLVRRFAEEELMGRRLLVWNGRGGSGDLLPPGLYLMTFAGEEGEAASMSLGVADEDDRSMGQGTGSGSRVIRTTLVVAP